MFERLGRQYAFLQRGGSFEATAVIHAETAVGVIPAVVDLVRMATTKSWTAKPLFTPLHIT